MKKILSLLAILSIFLFSACSSEKKATVDLNAVKSVSTSFGEAIADADYAKAYSLTSTKYKNSTSQDAFSKEVSDWIKNTGITSLSLDLQGSSHEKFEDSPTWVASSFLWFDITAKDEDGTPYEEGEAISLDLSLEGEQYRIDNIELGRQD